MTVDTETGEPNVVMGRHIAPEIAEAIVAVMGEIKQLGFDERNEHGKYNYVSIDKFMEMVRPLCFAAGIYFLLDETEVEVRQGGREGATSYLFINYDVWIGHKTGTMAGPWRRRCFLPATGPQAFGAAESYVLKRFQRNLFQIATGDRDADAESPGNVPARTNVTPMRASRVTPAQRDPEQTVSVEQAKQDRDYLNQCIAACETAEQLRDIYDPDARAGAEWGDNYRPFAARIVAVPKSGPAVLNQIVDRVRTRWAMLTEERGEAL